MTHIEPLSLPVRGPFNLPRAGRLPPELLPQPTETIVLRSSSGQRTALPAGAPPTFSMRGFPSRSVAYYVDTTPRLSTLPCQLPSAEPGILFTGRLQITWRVADAIAATSDDRLDVHGTIAAWYEPHLRRLGRTCGVSEADFLEDEIRKALSLPVRLGSVIEVTTVEPLLDMDTELREANRARTLDDVRREHATKILQGGEEALRATLMARDPGQLATVLGLVREDRRIEIEVGLKKLQMLLASEKAEPYQLDEFVQSLVTEVTSSLLPALPTDSAASAAALPSAEKRPDEKPNDASR